MIRFILGVITGIFVTVATGHLTTEEATGIIGDGVKSSYEVGKEVVTDVYNNRQKYSNIIEAESTNDFNASNIDFQAEDLNEVVEEVVEEYQGYYR